MRSRPIRRGEELAGVAPGAAIRAIRPDAERLVEQLPADASPDDLAFEAYVRKAIDQGLADADVGRTVDHDAALARVRAGVLRAS